MANVNFPPSVLFLSNRAMRRILTATILAMVVLLGTRAVSAQQPVPPTNLDGFDLERGPRRFQNLQRGIHNFGADAIAVRDRDGSFLGHRGNTQDIPF